MSNKLKKKPSTRLSPEAMTAAEVSGITGVKLEILRKWVDRMQKSLSEAYQKEAQEKLLKAEDCISAANVVCSALAIYETWGYKKALDRYMDNYTAIVKQMNEVGIKKMYEELHAKTGAELEFEDMDIAKEFGFGVNENGTKK
nr:MAG TPA: Trans-activating transcriptional regulator [Caudoviricetes sp.]